MTLLQSPLWWIVFAYFLGGIPMGVLVARVKGIDLRRVGSGNIGATNATRALGAKLGLCVFGLDALKAALPVFLAGRGWALGTHPDAEPWLAGVAFAAVMGHIFPLYLRFRGGKGVACALGVFLSLDPAVALAALVMYVQGLWLTRTSAVGSLTAVSAIAMSLLLGDRPESQQALGVVVAAVIWWRHASNIRQLVSEAKARKLAANRPDVDGRSGL